MKYSMDWLIDQYENGKPLKLLYFWGHTPKYNEEIGKHVFSQWYKAPFTIGTTVYKTSEHYMMAQKALLFKNQEIFSEIIACHKPSEVKELGREIKNFDDEIWNTYKYEIVKTGNIHKFNQNNELASFLISTGNHVIVEASPVDAIWGIGMSQDSPHIDNLYMWRGQNLLGFALMETRDFLNTHGHFILPEITPPWLLHPEQDPADVFWRMGKGEDVIADFSKIYYALPEAEKKFYQLAYPLPPGWEEFY